MHSQPNPTAKIKVKEYELLEKSTKVKLEDDKIVFIPNSVITGWNPATKKLEVEYWFLNKRGIPYRL